jgi:hypothetical protein
MNESCAVDAHSSTVVNAVAEFFVVTGLNHRPEVHDTRRVIKKPFGNGNRGHESGVKLGEGVF